MVSYCLASVIWLSHCHASWPCMLLTHCHIALPVILLRLCHVDGYWHIIGVLAGPLVEGTVPHCSAMYFTVPSLIPGLNLTIRLLCFEVPVGLLTMKWVLFQHAHIPHPMSHYSKVLARTLHVITSIPGLHCLTGCILPCHSPAIALLC